MNDDRDEIERLKVHKIPPAKERRHLPTLGQPHPYRPDEESVTEAVGEGAAPPAGPVDSAALEATVVEALKTIFDPEIPVSIYELGLIYGIDVDAKANVELRMTLTAPACPVAGQLVTEVAEKVGRVPGVARAHVTLVWDPPWSPDRMTDEAKLELGLL
jgi:FeS assembly SUF system protein